MFYMAILYECTVSNCYSLNIRSGPGMSFPPVAWLQRGDVVKVDGVSNGWYKLQGQERYGYKDYLAITKDLSGVSVQPSPAPAPAKAPAVSAPTTVSPTYINRSSLNTGSKRGATQDPSAGVSGNGLVNIDEGEVALASFNTVNSGIKVSKETNTANPRYKGFYLNTNTSYPPIVDTKNGVPQFNWYMNHRQLYGASSSMYDMFRKIQENMNIATFYSREDINQRIHTNFNRFQLEFPDVYLKNTIGVMFFTRPDLNLFNNGQMTAMIANDPRCNLIVSNHPTLSKLLTKEGLGDGHYFNPLLSNMAQSLDIQDDSVDTLEVGESYVGYKMQYSKHNVKSITSGTITVKFKETFDTAITNTHQLWVDYQSNVYRGIFEPKEEYIWGKELDYACDIYYFLLDQDGETIRFWSKYYGCFPHNVPKSVYSYDFGAQVQFPELSVTYGYTYKEDLSPVALIEFNKNSNIAPGQSTTYVKNYNTQLGTCGPTWVGKPFIYSYMYNNGAEDNIQGFKLGWKKA